MSAALHDELLVFAQRVFHDHGVLLHSVNFEWLDLAGVDDPTAAMCNVVSVKSSKRGGTPP